jgi:hypothetical protein
MAEAGEAYHAACPTLKAFIRQHRTTMLADWAERNPNIDSMPPGLRQFRCTLRCGHRRMTVYFSQGPAIEHEPTVEDVLDCLASDAAGAADTFEDWCAELGYDSDSRKAEQTYRLIREQSEKLAALLGPAFGELLKVERL